MARRLTGVELQLSRIVAKPPVTWQIDPLAREVEQLLAQAKTADERQAVQSTLAKIDRFAAIGRRYRGDRLEQWPHHPANRQSRRSQTANSRQPKASATTPSASCGQSSPSEPVHRSSRCSTNTARSCHSSRRHRTSTCSRTSATASASPAAADTSPSFNGHTSLPGVLRRSARMCCDNVVTWGAFAGA